MAKHNVTDPDVPRLVSHIRNLIRERDDAVESVQRMQPVIDAVDVWRTKVDTDPIYWTLAERELMRKYETYVQGALRNG